MNTSRIQHIQNTARKDALREREREGERGTRRLPGNKTRLGRDVEIGEERNSL